MSDYTCPHCGKSGLGMLGHYFMGMFTCLEGQENEELHRQGLPMKWKEGQEIDHVCPSCGQAVLKE